MVWMLDLLTRSRILEVLVVGAGPAGLAVGACLRRRGVSFRFHDIEAAIAFCRSFFPWYNVEHRHGGIAMLTPDDVHHGRARDVLAQRERILEAAWANHPERFVRGIPKPRPLPEAVWINPPATTTTGGIAQ